MNVPTVEDDENEGESNVQIQFAPPDDVDSMASSIDSDLYEYLLHL